MKTRKLIAYEKTGGRCIYCGCHLDLRSNDFKDRVTLDHVICRQRGGINHISNLVPSCWACNVSKGNDHLSIWMQRKRDLIGFEQFGLPIFDPGQVEYLRSRGMKFPHDFLPYEFWFERNGWKVINENLVHDDWRPEPGYEKY